MAVVFHVVNQLLVLSSRQIIKTVTQNLNIRKKKDFL
jgi:hypothetical protein